MNACDAVSVLVDEDQRFLGRRKGDGERTEAGATIWDSKRIIRNHLPNHIKREEIVPFSMARARLARAELAEIAVNPREIDARRLLSVAL